MYRTALNEFLTPGRTVSTLAYTISPLMAQLIFEAQLFVISCTEEGGNEARGGHFFQISGHDRNNKQVSDRRSDLCSSNHNSALGT